MTKLTPLRDRVIVEKIHQADRTASGLYIPEAAKEKPNRGRVHAVGPGKYEGTTFVAPTVKEGDIVLFGKYAGSMVELDGKELLLLIEADVFAIIKEESA